MTRFSRLSEGDVLTDISSGRHFRILHLQLEEVVIFDMTAPLTSQSKSNAKPALPEHRPLADILHGIAIGMLKLSPPPDNAIDSAQLTKAELAFISRAHPILQSLAKCEPRIYEPNARGAIVRMAQREFSCSRQTIFKYLRSYWIAGKDINAVISEFRRCGAPGISREPGEAKRGRPRSEALRTALGAGVNVTKKDVQNIRKLIPLYKNNPAWSINDLHDHLSLEYRVIEQGEDGRRRLVVDDKRIITPHQLSYHLEKLLSEEVRSDKANKISKSTRPARRRHDGKLASLPEVGEIAEIDALRINASLVSEVDRSLVLGSVVVFIVIEYSSEMIMGIAMGWDGEDYETLCDALINCVVDKQALCAEYGINIDADEWPVQHWTQRMHADRGLAGFSTLSNRIGKALKPNPFANAPGGSPESKGGVESTVKLFKRLTAKFVPGSWVGKFGHRERGTPSPHCSAGMTRKELMAVLLDIAMLINSKVRKQTQTRVDLISDKIASSPLETFRYALNTHRNRLQKRSADTLRRQLLSRLKAKVGERGIAIGDELYYYPAEAHDFNSEWFKRLERDKETVEAAVDRRTVDTIFIIPPGQRDRFIRCVLTARSKQFAGMSLREVQAIRARRSATNTIAATKTLTSRAAIKERLVQRREYAIAETKRARGASTPSQSQISNRRENRAEEKAHERDKLNERLDNLAPATRQSSPAPVTPRFDYPDMDEDVPQ